MIIISLLNHDKYNKKFWVRLFGSTKYSIDKPRKWQATNLDFVFPEKKTLTRIKLNHKCEHLTDFVFSSGILDVVYGTLKMNSDSGDKQLIPCAILTTKFSHIYNCIL